jgi:hypothetical protein
MAEKKHSRKEPDALSDSDNAISQARIRDSAELDLAVAYVLGEASDEERAGFETALAAGDEGANHSYADATNSISELSSILSPEAPPPFAKEKVMARVRDGTIVFFVPPPDRQLSLIHQSDP